MIRRFVAGHAIVGNDKRQHRPRFPRDQRMVLLRGEIGSLVPSNRAALRGISALRSGDVISWKVALRAWILRNKRLCNTDVEILFHFRRACSCEKFQL